MAVAKLKDLLNTNELRIVKAELLDMEVRELRVIDLNAIGLFLTRFFYEKPSEIDSIGAAALHVLTIRAQKANKPIFE